MNLKRFSGGTLGLLVAGAVAWGCSSKADDCKANKSCNPYDGGATGTSGSAGSSGTNGQSGNGGASGNNAHAGHSGDAGNSGEAGAAGAPSTCDGTLSPDADGCVISDAYGVFVAPTGDDTTGDGTEAAPYATLTNALAKLGTIKRIYVCAAEYQEPSTLEIPGGVSIYGGFGCDGGVWTYDSANNKASFKPMSPIGAELKNADGVTLQDLSITADDATSPGASSFGMMVVSSDGVALTRVVIKAGKGGAGMAGSNGDPGAPGSAPGADQNGLPGTCTSPSLKNGGKSASAICTSQGGNGGAGYQTAAPLPEQNGGPGSPVLSANGGPGGIAVGDPGAPGTFGKGGADGLLGLVAEPTGSFSGTGYTVASGAAGLSGKPGQGGGGGGASFVSPSCVGSSGGAGGMGGCGGQPGTGGTGGGASVALLSWTSTITLDSCVLTAVIGGGGGAGGVGGLGGAGQAGGTGGMAGIAGIKDGGKGGDGGNGGDGGSGAGGTGGPSIALVYNGTEPVRKNTKLEVPTKGGASGQGGHFGADDTRWGPDGSVGLVQDIYPTPTPP
jgi:hypothetical protein